MYPSVIQDRFIESEADEICLMGPRGEGKTEAGIMAMTIHAIRIPENVRPLRVAIIRDTWKNLERTTLESLKNPWPDSFAATIRPYLEFREGGSEISFPGYWKAYLFGIDSLGDLDKLQSMQLGMLWIEEAAPVNEPEIAALGVSEKTWTVGISSMRQPCKTRCQITMNYPEEEHWTWQRFHERMVGELFQIPPGENKHVTDEYRRKMREAFKKDPALLARLVEGKPYPVQIGKAVTPEYNEERHRAKCVLDPLPGKVIRFWDGGQTPACVFGQIVPSGKLHILDTIQAFNMGMEQIIESKVKPMMADRYFGIKEWIDTGDPSLASPEQSNSNYCAAKIINDKLNTSFIGGEPSFAARKEWIKERLIRDTILLSRQERVLHRALSGGWHYKTSPSGKVSDEPDKNDEHSHAIDAVCHGGARLFGAEKRESMPIRVRTGIGWIDQQQQPRRIPRWAQNTP